MKELACPTCKNIIKKELKPYEAFDCPHCNTNVFLDGDKLEVNYMLEAF